MQLHGNGVIPDRRFPVRQEAKFPTYIRQFQYYCFLSHPNLRELEFYSRLFMLAIIAISILAI